MSLFVRVFNNFYTHRKTARLKAVIGDAAFWVPPRLWAYAAENQPDGCFKEYSAEEIAMLIGYLGDAKAMLEAMLRASFMDDKPLRIHDWADYNDYHAKYSARASKASKVRWENERRRQEKERIGEDRRGEEASIAQASVKECLEHNGGPADERVTSAHAPEIEHALKWLKSVQGGNPPADYTEKELRAAHRELSVNGWMWGRNPIVDWRAAIECRIQENRNKNGTNSQNRKPTVSEIRNSTISGADRAASDAIATVARRQREADEKRAQKAATQPVAAEVAGHGGPPP